jgi:chromosome partitioning protein
MKTIVIHTRKGGVGKSTVAVLLAWFFAATKRKTLFIDLDPQANSSKTLAAWCNPTLAGSNLFNGDVEIVPSIVDDAGESLSVIKADTALDTFGQTDAQRIVTHFIGNLKRASTQFDICIVDTPPAAGVTVVAAMIGADWVLSPIDAETYSIDGIQSTLQMVKGITTKYNKSLQFLGILANKIDGRSQAQNDAVEALIKNYSHLMLPGKIKESEAIAAVSRLKIPVWKIPTSSARVHGKAVLELFSLIEKKVFA